MHVLSSFQRTGLASNEPRRLSRRLGNLAILLTLGFFCQPLSEVFFRIFFQRRAAVPGSRALIEVGVANPRFSERKKNLLAVFRFTAEAAQRRLEQICQPPGRVTLGKVSIRTALWLCQLRFASSGAASSVGSCPATASPCRTVCKERSVTIRVLGDGRKSPQHISCQTASGLTARGESAPHPACRPATGTRLTAVPHRALPSRR